jgi:hypothetical protein
MPGALRAGTEAASAEDQVEDAIEEAVPEAAAEDVSSAGDVGSEETEKKED